MWTHFLVILDTPSLVLWSFFMSFFLEMKHVERGSWSLHTFLRRRPTKTFSLPRYVSGAGAQGGETDALQHPALSAPKVR